MDSERDAGQQPGDFAAVAREAAAEVAREQALRLALEVERDRLRDALDVGPSATLRDANERLVESALAAQEAAEREHALRQQLEALAQTARRQTQYLDAILSASPDAIFVFDRDRRLSYVSTAGAKALGLRPEEIVGKTPRDLAVRSEVTERIESQLAEVFATGQQIRGEGTATTHRGVKNYEYILSPVAATGPGVETVVASVRDITDRKFSEEALARSEAEWRLVAAEMDAAIAATADALIVQDRDGRVLRMSAAAEEMLGLGPAELTKQWQAGLPDLKIANANGGAVAFDELPAHKALRGEKVRGTMLQISRTDMAPIWVSASAAPIRTPDGAVLGAVSTLTDITPLHELQERQREYVGLISHDLRNPLGGLMGMGQLLRRDLEQQGKAREVHIIEVVIKNAKRMAAMIDDLVESARLEAGQLQMRKEDVDLLRLVIDLVERMGSPEERRRIKIECFEHLPPALVDPHRLERAITNLVTNALKYSPEDKPVTVRLGRQNGFAILTVRDEGIGIPPEDQARLFTRHFRAKSAGHREGLGLGLYITRLIAEAHGGQVSVKSEPGKGSTFKLTVPTCHS